VDNYAAVPTQCDVNFICQCLSQKSGSAKRETRSVLMFYAFDGVLKGDWDFAPNPTWERRKLQISSLMGQATLPYHTLLGPLIPY